MEGTRMVPLTPVQNEFAGRVLVAKLGSAGILAELRGVSRIYPTVLGEAEVWVEASELTDAKELITADLDDALVAEPDNAPITVSRSWTRVAMVVIATLLLISFAYTIRSCDAPTTQTSSRVP